MANYAIVEQEKPSTSYSNGKWCIHGGKLFDRFSESRASTYSDPAITLVGVYLGRRKIQTLRDAHKNVQVAQPRIDPHVHQQNNF